MRDKNDDAKKFPRSRPKSKRLSAKGTQNNSLIRQKRGVLEKGSVVAGRQIATTR